MFHYFIGVFTGKMPKNLANLVLSKRNNNPKLGVFATFSV